MYLQRVLKRAVGLDRPCDLSIVSAKFSDGFFEALRGAFDGRDGFADAQFDLRPQLVRPSFVHRVAA